MGEEHFSQREQQVQRLRGVNVLGRFEEQQGGQCGCSRGSKERGEENPWSSRARLVRPCKPCKCFGFYSVGNGMTLESLDSREL